MGLLVFVISQSQILRPIVAILFESFRKPSRDVMRKINIIFQCILSIQALSEDLFDIRIKKYKILDVFAFKGFRKI